MMHQNNFAKWMPGRHPGASWRILAPHALVLAHDGKAVKQARGWLPEANGFLTKVGMDVKLTLAGDERGVTYLCGACIDLGTIIFLDANGRERGAAERDK